MAAVQAGVGRETAHEAIKEHAVAVALEMREAGRADNDLLTRLGNDSRLPLDSAALEKLIASPIEFVGAAQNQVSRFIQSVEALRQKYPKAAAYQPGSIL